MSALLCIWIGSQVHYTASNLFLRALGAGWPIHKWMLLTRTIWGLLHLLRLAVADIRFIMQELSCPQQIKVTSTQPIKIPSSKLLTGILTSNQQHPACELMKRLVSYYNITPSRTIEKSLMVIVFAISFLPWIFLWQLLPFLLQLRRHWHCLVWINCHGVWLASDWRDCSFSGLPHDLRIDCASQE